MILILTIFEGLGFGLELLIFECLKKRLSFLHKNLIFSNYYFEKMMAFEFTVDIWDIFFLSLGFIVFEI